MANPIMAFLGMFDKIDDIIYEPVKVICDGIRQPLKQLDASAERKKIELNHQLEIEMQQMGVELEVDKERKLEELEQWRLDQESERNKDVLNTIEEYQKNMGTTAVAIGNAIGTMSIELQSKAQNMVIEKTKLFRDQQMEVLHDASQGINDIQQMYPEDSDLKMEIIKPYTEMMTNVVRETNAFILDMKNSMVKLTDNINDITKKVVSNTDEYIKPLCGGQLSNINNKQMNHASITNESNGYIESK